MAASVSLSFAPPGRTAAMVCVAAMVSLAVAMGVGRFAFTPLFPLMVRDGLLTGEAGAVIAASNYLGYLVGALAAGRIPLRPGALVALGLISTVLATAAVGWTASVPVWVALRFVAGVMSAWTLVATSAWGLGWLARLGRPHLAGTVFAGVGLGIAGAGLFCLVVAGPGVSSRGMWVQLAGWAGVAALLPLWVVRSLPAAAASPVAVPTEPAAPRPPARTGGLVACYTLFGFGYILPATYLPALARQLVDDPQVFGLAWPLFGLAAALSTIVVSWALQRANRLRVWAASHLLMVVGVLLPCVWASLASVTLAALLVGGTFMVITMLAMQEARARAEAHATIVLGRMTAGFALGQLLGPLASAAIGRFTADFATALNHALVLSAAGLLLSAIYLWREARRPAIEEQR